MATLRDIKLGADGDIDVSKQDLQLVSDLEAINQSVKIRLQFFQTEWFADESVGVPYFDQVLVKNPNANALNSVFRDVILGTPGIISLSNLSLDYDSAHRRLSVTFTANTDFGELATTVTT